MPEVTPTASGTAPNTQSPGQTASPPVSPTSGQSQSQSQSQGQSGTNGGSSNTQSAISIPATAAAGGVSLTQPQATVTSFYKLAPSQLITFGWNFTSLYRTPLHLTVSAICPDNGMTYPVGPTDGIIPGTATDVTWDPYAWQTANPGQQLVPGRYQLLIMDESGSTAIPQGGLFSPNTQLTFALYTTQPYTPLASGWQCTACKSGAIGSAASNPLFAGGLTTIAVMLISGWGLLFRRGAAAAH